MYRWLVRKQKGKIHDLDEQGLTYCKVENNGDHTRRGLSAPSPNPPKDRKHCWCCKQVKRERLHAATIGMLDAEYREIMR